MLCFTCDERKICPTIKKSQKYYDHDFLQNLVLLSMSLLTTLIVKSSHILAGIYYIFLKKCPRPNLRGCQYLN